MCLNKKVLAGVAVAAAAVYLLEPGLIGAALPVLVVAVCPLSMLVMMKSMSRRGDEAAAGRDGGSGVDDELAQLRREVAELRSAQPGAAGLPGTERQNRR